MKNIYKAIDTTTGEVVKEASADEFKDFGLGATSIYLYTNSGRLYKDKYRFECSKRVRTVYRNGRADSYEGKEKELNELEKMNAEARKHGMSYGQYVFFMEGIPQYKKRK